MSMEETIMTLVVKSGQARSAAYEALGEAKQGRFEEAQKKMQESAQWVMEAHDIQTELLVMEARGEMNQIDRNISIPYPTFPQKIRFPLVRTYSLM